MTEVAGYLHILVQTLEVDGANQPLHAHITVGQIAKMDTEPKNSGETINDVFLVEIPKDPSRFILKCLQGQKILAQCRYDIHPFIERAGITHSAYSDLFGEDNKKIGHARLKLTYHSAQYGHLKVRIFGLQFHPQFVSEYKQAKIRVISGIHAQSTPVRKLNQPFDEEVLVTILKPTVDLSFELIHEKGTIASYTIKNIKEAGILCEQPKAYQVSLKNNGKPLGNIKYRIDWVK